ncbi:exodeoxyribonuclease V subunit gamma [Chromatium okenii]|uniref:exodeoxyribonuclease V subunit gamma n=1 Tax=Chromatium okenii TaxID=61644 RepID=UPI003221775A
MRLAAALRRTDVTLPGRFIWQAYRQVLGDLPHSSPFDKEPLTWRLYRLLGNLDALAEIFAPLTGFLSGDDHARRRHQLAAKLADLFDQYQVYRADWLTAWQDGDDVLIRPHGSREPIPEAQRWQPALWRLLVADIQIPPVKGGEEKPPFEKGGLGGFIKTGRLGDLLNKVNSPPPAALPFTVLF